VQKIVSKYATAAHLALLAVAPLFLSPFLTAGKIAVVMLWLSLVAVLWVVMEPSRRHHEMPADARGRVLRAVVRDPVFWFSLVAIGLTAIRCLNNGISLAYDAEETTWMLRKAAWPFLPGSVGETGLPAFAACVTLSVLLLGARHALGRSARLAFFAVATMLSGLAGTISAFAFTYGHAGVIEMAMCSPLVPSYSGLTWGLFLVGGVVGLFACVEMKWHKAEPLVALGLLCTAIGFVIYATVSTLCVFTVVFLLVVLLSFALQTRQLEGSGSLRCALGVLCAVLAAAAVLFVLPDSSPVGQKRLSLQAMALFPEKFFETRAVLSRIACDVWKNGPWLGSGLGSFPFDIRFGATPADWALIDPAQKAVPSAWWLLLAERGVVGSSLFVVGLACLLGSYFFRMARVIRTYRWQPVNGLFLLILGGVVAVSFVECSLLRADVLPVVAVFLALSANAFPSRPRESAAK
jgi:hypothetical protein